MIYDSSNFPSLISGLKSLRKLRVLHLETNDFNISTLKSLGRLSLLKELYLGGNKLEGSVTLRGKLKYKFCNAALSFSLVIVPFSLPELNNLRNLEVLDLSSTNISSSILQIVEVMTSLKALSLRSNGINGSQTALQGTFYNSLNFGSKHLLILNGKESFILLPLFFFSGLCKLRNLQELDLSDNGFEGSVSPCLGNLTSLRALDLSKNRFSGNLDSSLFAGLMKLEFLSLSHNVFQTFPPISSFAKHSKLEVLDLICGNNTLLLESEDQTWVPSFQLKVFRLSSCILKTGSIPSFLHHQHDLRVVDLSNSSLEEDFPTWLMKNNTRLEELNLKNNSLTGYFHLPYRPHIFTSAIDISNNLLQGQMPSNISVSLPNLMFLNVSRNSFEGSIPSFGGMRKLLFLDLSNNLFTGGIPEDLAMGCPSLEYLILSKNDLHGQMFPRVSNLPSLRHLELDDNHFSGKIPDLSNSSGLERLDVSHNSISGKLPGWIGNMSNLAALVMPNNSLEGPIPVEFCSLDALELLDLSNNNLSGSLPSCFSPSLLIHVHLQENHLTGPLTKAFTRSMDLATLDIRNNNLSGGIPDWISMFSGLSILLLKGNHFQGKIPYQLCQLSKITILDLSYNSLSGHIPSCLNKIRFRTGFRSGKFSIISYFQSPGFSSYLYHSQHIELSQVNVNSYPIAYDKAMAEFTAKNRTDFYKGNFLYSMTGIDLSSNKLTGAIPPEIGNLSQVHALNLSHNILTGPIPAAFSGLKSIESLDLSYNNLTGTIPGELTELTNLAVFSVAYNNLSGKIPEMTAQFGTFLENSYVGNPYLCGSLLRKNCSRAEEEAEIEEGEKGLTDRDIFYVSFGASYVVVLLGVAAVLYINGGWRKKWFHVIDVLITCCCNFVMHLVGKFSG